MCPLLQCQQASLWSCLWDGELLGLFAGSKGQHLLGNSKGQHLLIVIVMHPGVITASISLLVLSATR